MIALTIFIVFFFTSSVPVVLWRRINNIQVKLPHFKKIEKKRKSKKKMKQNQIEIAFYTLYFANHLMRFAPCGFS